MGLADAFGRDTTTELKVTELVSVLRSEASAWAKNEVMLNGIRAKIPHKHILTMVGESDCVTGVNQKESFSSCNIDEISK